MAKDLSLQDYQKLVRELVIERGYDKETVSEVFTLLVEEVGELAKAIRKTNGTQVHLDSRTHEVGEELADVFWLVIDLCNRLNVNLAQVFADKERKNQKRQRQ